MKRSKPLFSSPREFVKGVPITLWLFFLVLIPLFYTFLMSFYSADGLVISEVFTIENYKLFFTDPLYHKIFVKTMGMSLMVAALSMLMSYPLAYLVAFKIKRGKNLLFMLCIIPLWVSYLVRIIAWRVILGNKGVINSILLALGLIREPLTFLLYNQFAVAITLTYICIPFIFIPVYTSLEKIPRNIIHAAYDLGASEIRTFVHIIFPLSLPGFVTGFIFAFIIAMGDYIIPQQLGGTQSIMYGNLIWSQFGFAFNWPLGAALGFILFFVVVLILGLTYKFGSTEGGVLSE
jgi:spermidine/putrescine transport system permease protein